MSIDLSCVPTPCYIVEEEKLKKNLAVLDYVQQKTNCKILLALKAFSMYAVFPILNKKLKGTAASSLNEARLGYEKFGREVHLCAPAYKEEEIKKLIFYSSHIVFNSFSQVVKFKKYIQNSPKKIKCGIRINPEVTEVKTTVYNPCCKNSRLGVTLKEFKNDLLNGITGLHFHTLCESNADALERTLTIVEKNFSPIIKKMQWINFGGGHHITRKNYDIKKLCKIILNFKKNYSVEVYLEPGEAVVLNAGVLVASVLDIIYNKMNIAVLDVSASAHIPDVLEMPYRPEILTAGKPKEKPYLYKLTGPTCLAGDIIGDYSFAKPLKVGDKLIFTDMLHYTMVKNTTFNGVNLPSIAIWTKDKKLKIIKKFGYEDYRERL